MLQNIRDEIRSATNAALDTAIRCVELSDEAMTILVQIPRRFQKATVVIQAQKRPFPLNKMEPIIRNLRGTWNKKNTLCNFTKIESPRMSNPISLKIRFYAGPCLNPSQEIDVLKGSRGKVLDPTQCNGAERPIMAGLGIVGEQKKGVSS